MDDATVNGVPDKPLGFWRWCAVVGMLLAAVAAGGAVGWASLSFYRQGFQQPMGTTHADSITSHDYKPQNPDERRLLANLRPANHDEDQTLRIRAYQYGVARVKANGLDTYIAIHDLVLPPQPLGQTLIIGVPAGIHWVSGPLTGIVLVLADVSYDAPTLQLAFGKPVSDPLCFVYSGNTPVCEEPDGQVAPTQFDTSQLRKLTMSELAKDPYAGAMRRLASADYHDVYLATTPVRLSPNFGSKQHGPVIIVDAEHGGRIIGGRTTWTQVVTLDDPFGGSGPGFSVVRDPVYLAAQYGEASAYCYYFSRNVQQQYYPGACA